VDVYGVNDGMDPAEGTLLLRFVSFDGRVLSEVSLPAAMGAVESKLLTTLNIREHLKGSPEISRKDAALIAEFIDENGETVFRQNALLVPDRLAALRKPVVNTDLSVNDREATLTLSSDVYARHVYVEIEGTDGPLSDNYVDLEVGQIYRIHFTVTEGAELETLKESLKIKTLADISVKGTAAGDSVRRFLFRLKPYNFLTWLLYKFV
jgi:beta-mannosidase